MQAFTLHDKKFVRSNTSNPVEFVCAVEKRKRFFKKVSSPTDKLFLVPQTGRSYEQQLTNIERFFLRSNSIQISLAKFIMLDDEGVKFGCPPGRGYTYKDLASMLKNIDSYIGKRATFTYFQRTQAGSYRHPLFKCIRNYE